jgi:hypothetical protein
VSTLGMVVARSVAGKLLELVVNDAWYDIKCKRTWDWLDGDKELQKSMMMMVQREEEKSRLMAPEKKKAKRLLRKQEMQRRKQTCSNQEWSTWQNS